MAWIESHQSLRDHPKTKRLARLLGISKVTAIGHLQCLWWWTLDYAQDGDISRFDAADIADAVEWEGDAETFFRAMLQSGFIDRCDDDQSQTVHDWPEYAGRLVAKREQNAARQRDWRERNRATANQSDNVTVTSTLRDTHVQGLPTEPTEPTEPISPPTPSPGESDKPKRVRSVKTPVPENLLELIPPETWAVIRVEQRLTDDQLKFETALMVDHYQAKGERRPDWVASWRGWMRSEYRQSKPTVMAMPLNGEPQPPPGYPTMDAWYMSAEYRQQRHEIGMRSIV